MSFGIVPLAVELISADVRQGVTDASPQSVAVVKATRRHHFSITLAARRVHYTIMTKSLRRHFINPHTLSAANHRS